MKEREIIERKKNEKFNLLLNGKIEIRILAYNTCGILPFVRSNVQAFAMPTTDERTTQKAHADMYNTRNLPLFSQKRHGCILNTHQEDVLVAIRHSGVKVCEVLKHRKTNACKRLLYIHRLPHHRRLSAEVRCKCIKK